MGANLITTMALSGATIDEPRTAVRVAAAPRAAEDAVRLAFRLRDCRSTAEGRVLVFVPATSGERVNRLVYETTVALDEMQEGPVLVLDLQADRSDVDPLFSEWPLAVQHHATGDRLDRNGTVPRVAFAQPIAPGVSAVPAMTSPEFAGLLALARSQYSYVLCMVGPIADAVEGLVAASLSDGVVLSVKADRTRIAEIHEAQRQLTRVHAPVLGFVVDQGPRRAR